MTHLDKVPGYPEYRTSPKSPVYPIVQFVSTDKNGLKPDSVLWYDSHGI